MRKSFGITLLIALLAFALIIVGCAKEGETPQGENKKEKPKRSVELAYVEWSSELASTNVVKAVLQEKMGYECEILPLGAAQMWQGVATGDVDGMVSAWLPVTHANYYEEMKNNIIDLGENLKGAKIGLVVPEYVEIDSIAEMKEHGAKFNNKIIGIDPGAGVMQRAERAIEEYDLTNIELIEGSDAAMIAALADAINNKEWVAVTGWTPHWKFSRWDLKYLEDPKKAFGEEEYITTIVRKGLKEDMPEVYEFLDKFNWTLDDMQQVQVWNEEGGDPYDNAVRWINENEEKVNSWLP